MSQDASRISRATGRRQAAIHVEVTPARGQPDKLARAGELDEVLGADVGGGYVLPLSHH